MENAGGGVPFYDLGQTRVYPLFSDFHHLSAERYPVGFMDLLGVHHHFLTHTPPMHFPTTTPNSSSSDAVNDDHEKKRENEEEEEEEEDGEQQHKTYKRDYRFKITKSTSEKTKLKVPKVSFITKSEVLNLDDGYKWRKYGQKPVRNSPFPRNYYRCTTTWCDVKKRVERSFSDPSSVITTYEGQHSHPRPLPKGDSLGFNGSASRAHFGLPTLPPQLLDYNNHQQQGQSSFGAEYIIRQEKGSDDDDEDDHDYAHVVKKSRTQDLLDGAGSVKEHGLLQDVVSSHIIKEEC
ncbi:PREDICTED: probable WRKY transcription factor 68 [Camelina sativa]|uniref:Probable WRKY transcription factor 68 n=1 Tax=Camelina sativa TaxID=90675 RepID=A0ABM0ZA69_CAMSA|nr:PREDICTED: probable WRKY transcription factor 68 [Camelina sativa]